ncbi:hypothetical protein ABB07_14860 [Streptomyces incarnatus]|uniref:Uncharacterized protein n=1 Tax=Streptomyces incarnatus TaxID=665007 RepID=A0ABM5TJX6_9ACTN|nr:hypothetical protein ABB07_14860 [Streptomyces incarnatus]
MAGLPGPVRGALGRWREGIVVLPPTAASVTARATVPPRRAVTAGPAGARVPAGPALPRGLVVTCTATRTTMPAGLTTSPGSSAPTALAATASLRRRCRPLSQHRATLASPGRAEREREDSQAAIGHQKSVFP